MNKRHQINLASFGLLIVIAILTTQVSARARPLNQGKHQFEPEDNEGAHAPMAGDQRGQLFRGFQRSPIGAQVAGHETDEEEAEADDTDATTSGAASLGGEVSRLAAMQSVHSAATNVGQPDWLLASQMAANNGGQEFHGMDTNIANAKIQLTAHELATAAGHHHHHGHYVHGKLDMGAHTGKKGSFGWHDKHPVGKGR